MLWHGRFQQRCLLMPAGTALIISSPGPCHILRGFISICILILHSPSLLLCCLYEAHWLLQSHSIANGA